MGVKHRYYSSGILLGRGLQNKGEVAGVILLLCVLYFLL